MAYEVETLQFAENQATRIGYTRNAKTGVRELTRGWKCSVDEIEASSQEFLATRIYIDNPKANKKTYSGRWRVASFGWSAQAGMFVETLRFGWATSVLTTSLPNTECRISQATDQRADSRVLTLMWHSIADTAVKSCMDELTTVRTAGGFTNPVVQTVTHTGTWAIDTITPQQAEDGSYTLSVTIIKVAAVADIAALAALTGIRSYVRDINNPFGLEGGYASTAPKAGKSPTEGITLTYRAITTASRSVLEALGDEALLSLLDTSDKAKYKTVKAQVDEDTGNTLKLTVVYQYIPLKTATPESEARYVKLTRANQSGKLTLIRSWPRINPDYAKDLLQTNVNTKVTATTVTDPQADGKTYTGDWLAKSTEAPETDNDGVRIVQELVRSGDADVDVFLGDDPDHGSYTKHLFDASETAVNAFLAATTFPAVATRPAGWATVHPAWNTPENGITKVVKITNNADASLNLFAYYSSTAGCSHLDLYTGGTPGVLTVDPSYAESDERAWGWNIPVANLKTYSDHYKNSVTASENVNKKRDFKITRRNEHTFDFEGIIKTFTPTDSGDVVIEDTDEKTVTRRTGTYVLYASLAAGQTFGRPAVATAGTLVDVDAKLNEVGSFSVVKQTTVFKTLTTTVQSTKGTIEEVTETSIKAKAAATPDPTLTADAVNLLSEVKIVPRPDGLKDTEKKDTTLKTKALVSAVVVEKDAFHTKTLTKNINATSLTGPSTYGKADAKHNGAGGVDTDLEEIAELNASAAGGVSSLVEDVVVAKNTSTTSAAAAGGAVNVRVERDEEPTPGGKVKVTQSTITKKSVDSNAVITEKGPLLDTTTRILLNQTTVPTAEAGEKVDFKPNGLGAWDVVRIKKALQSGATVKTWESSSIVNHDPKQWQEKIPRYAWSTDSGDKNKLIGYWIYMFSASRQQVVSTSISRVFSLTMPSATPVTEGTGSSDGSGTSYKNRIVQLDADVWCEEKITITTTAWSAIGTASQLVAYLTYSTPD